MKKKNINMCLLLTLLQVTFCVEASAGKKQKQNKILSQKEAKALKAREDAEFDALMFDAAVENDKEYRNIIELKVEKNRKDYSEGKRTFFNDLTRKLRESHVSESSVTLIEDGYRALFNIEHDLSSRSINQRLVIHDQFLINFFHAFRLAVLANIMETRLVAYVDYIQKYIKELLDDSFFGMRTNFYGLIFKFQENTIDTIYRELQLIIPMQEEIVAILQDLKIDDSTARSNLLVLRDFLNFIDQRLS